VSWSWVESQSYCYLHNSTANLVANSAVVTGLISSTVNPAPLRTGKKGIGWTSSHSCSDLKLLSEISWTYGWSQYPDGNIVSCMNQLGISFVPMQWGAGGIDDLESNVWTNSGYILGFNEPNVASQSNLSPAEAASLWPQIEAVADKYNMLIGSSSAAPGGNISPEQWHDEFFGNCTTCRVDFITIHVYECTIGGLQYWVDTVVKYNKSIWLTEFSSACGASQPESDDYSYMTAALSWLDSQPQIERYSWYGTRIAPNDGYLGPNASIFSLQCSSLSNLGELYNGNPGSSGTPCPTGSHSSSSAAEIFVPIIFSAFLVIFYLL